MISTTPSTTITKHFPGCLIGLLISSVIFLALVALRLSSSSPIETNHHLSPPNQTTNIFLMNFAGKTEQFTSSNNLPPNQLLTFLKKVVQGEVDDDQRAEQIRGLNNMSQILVQTSVQYAQREAHDEQRTDCFDTSCIIIYNINYGRSGNSIMQLQKVRSILSKCSGASIAPKSVKDEVVRMLPFQVFGKPSCRPAWNELSDIEDVLLTLNTKCRAYNFSWQDSYGDTNCIKRKTNDFQLVSADRSFPSWLDFDPVAWAVPILNSTAVLHFRSGDVFSSTGVVHPSYTQPVCDHYLQSFRHSQAECALLVAEDERNPCLAVARLRLPCVRVLPPGCGPTCAFTLLSRARILIASASTFMSQAILLFSTSEPKHVYFSYCSDCPHIDGGVTKLCTETNRSELFPWKASGRQLEILISREARVVDCF